MTRTDAERVKRREIDRIRTQKAEAEERRCRNVIQAHGWRITRVTMRYGKPHYAICCNAGETYKFGSPEELAQEVTTGKRRHNTKEAIMASSKNSQSPQAQRGSAQEYEQFSKGEVTSKTGEFDYDENDRAMDRPLSDSASPDQGVDRNAY